MDTGDYQFYGTVLTIIGIIIAIVRGWLKQSERISAINERTLSLEKDIEEYKSNTNSAIDNANSDIDSIKSDRSLCRKDIYARIDEVVKMKDVDMKELTAAISKSIEKYSNREDAHHNEIIAKIEALSIQVATVKATFEEYRKK